MLPPGTPRIAAAPGVGGRQLVRDVLLAVRLSRQRSTGAQPHPQARRHARYDWKMRTTLVAAGVLTSLK